MTPLEKQKMLQRQSLPFEDKVELSKQRIKDWYKHWDGEVVISFSGGKDSTVLLHLVRSVYPDVEAVFSDTGLEMPEIREFVKKFDNVTRVRPKKSFKAVIEEDGYPILSKKISRQIRSLQRGPEGQEATYKLFMEGIMSNGEKSQRWKLADKWKYLIDSDIKASEKCCDHLKKEPLRTFVKETQKMPYSGMMAAEGGFRGSIPTCNAYDKAKPMSNPMLFWTEADVWEYIERYNVEICDVYYDRLLDQDGNQVATSKQPNFESLLEDKLTASRCGNIQIFHDGYKLVPGEKRTGCMFCMFGVQLEKNGNRFQRMYLTHPRHWDTCINKLGLKKPLELINVKYIP